MDQEELERIRETLESIRVTNVSKSLNYKNLHHTVFMIYYAEDENFSEEERKSNLLRTIAELELVYRENRDDIYKNFWGHIEQTLACARNDVKQGKYWAAITDINHLEELTPLKRYIPSLPTLEDNTGFRLLLAKKLLGFLDIKMIIRKSGYNKENPYNEEYLK